MVGALVLPLRDGPYVRALRLRPLALLGVASYSLYVWHLPIVKWLAIDSFGLACLACIPLCLAVAWASYRVIETPGLRLRRRWADSSAAQLPSPT
jgi:peptidoglycan/LPS O-acetylase OafA/YrhL